MAYENSGDSYLRYALDPAKRSRVRVSYGKWAISRKHKHYWGLFWCNADGVWDSQPFRLFEDQEAAIGAMKWINCGFSTFDVIVEAAQNATGTPAQAHLLSLASVVAEPLEIAAGGFDGANHSPASGGCD